MSSLFTKIINGEVPSHKVYEDNATYAFLNIYPSQPGHVLVVPRLEVDRFYDLPDDDYQKLMATVKKLAKHMEEVLGKRITVKIMGFDVPHAHVHLIPADTAAAFYASEDTTIEPDHAALAKMAQKLAL